MKSVLTAKELANALRISIAQVSRLTSAGKIPGARDLGTGKNHKWRFTEEIIEKWLVQEPSPTRPEAPPRRRNRIATQMQHSNAPVRQVIEKQNGNGKAHGTGHPITEIFDASRA